MANPVENKRIELILPADNGLMLVIRLTAAGVIARGGVTVDRMDDLKMAVEEACNCVLGQERSPEKLHVCFDLGGKTLGMSVEGVYADETLTAEAFRGERREDEVEIEKCILESLVDNADIKIVNGWIACVGMKAAVAQ